MCISVPKGSLFTESVAVTTEAQLANTSPVVLCFVATTPRTGTIARVSANTVEEIVICLAVVLLCLPGRVARFLLVRGEGDEGFKRVLLIVLVVFLDHSGG